jgi:hypothetical protein
MQPVFPYTNFAEFLWRTREWEYANFPTSQSRILFDILVLVEMYDASNKNLSIKELQSILPYSARGIRYAVEELVNRRYCQLTIAYPDRRVKSLRSTEKLKNLFIAYEKYIFR